LSLHLLDPETDKMVNSTFINSFAKPLDYQYSREKIITADLVKAMKEGKILGAGLDVLEYEKLSLKHFSRR
jgi:D-3-phosphoglycerate dehydrogenase